MYDIGAQIPLGFLMHPDYEEQWTPPSGLAGRDMYMRENYNLPQFMGVNMTQRERAVYDRYWPDLKTYMHEMAQSWVLGTQDVDKTWPDYQKYLQRHGYGKVIAVMQQAYDRQYQAAK